MIEFFANIFGYVLNFIYNIIQNYGLAIILFSILIKLVLLPLSIKQQKTMKKSAKIQEEVKAIQDKYKNNPEKLNQETLALYKRENMSPFSRMLNCNNSNNIDTCYVLFSKKSTYIYEENRT